MYTWHYLGSGLSSNFWIALNVNRLIDMLINLKTVEQKKQLALE